MRKETQIDNFTTKYTTTTQRTNNSYALLRGNTHSNEDGITLSSAPVVPNAQQQLYTFAPTSYVTPNGTPFVNLS
jgi:hypothetical protein